MSDPGVLAPPSRQKFKPEYVNTLIRNSLKSDELNSKMNTILYDGYLLQIKDTTNTIMLMVNFTVMSLTTESRVEI